MSSTPPIVIVGGGFSGAMLAARLAERGQASVVIDRGGEVGLGVAYSTPFDGHLLNVRSGRMSAVEGRPADFTDWLATHRPDLSDPEDFAPRRVYGLYVRDRLASVMARHPGRITLETGEAAAIEVDGVRLADGRRIAGRAVVLATGNPAPATAGREKTGDEKTNRIVGDPWVAGALDAIPDDAALVIVGTGLTMVDMIQWMIGRGWRGRAIALSRRGLLPRAHGPRADPPAELAAEALSGPVSRRLASARRQARGEGWRGVMEAYRPITARLWAEADTAERARMVRHLRPWWDVHRHRIAPRIAAAVTALLAEDRLHVEAGRLGRVVETEDGISVDWRPRGGGTRPPLTGDWLIDCTGPGHSPAHDPLTGPLIADGRARMDPLGLGLDLDEAARVRAADARVDGRLFVLGPPARAAFWETIAVPDIRKRIEALVEVLALPGA